MCRWGLRWLHLLGRFPSPSVLFLLGIALVVPEAAEEQLLEAPGYTSDPLAAVAGNDETKLAEFYKQHFKSIGGSYVLR